MSHRPAACLWDSNREFDGNGVGGGSLLLHLGWESCSVQLYWLLSLGRSTQHMLTCMHRHATRQASLELLCSQKRRSPRRTPGTRICRACQPQLYRTLPPAVAPLSQFHAKMGPCLPTWPQLARGIKSLEQRSTVVYSSLSVGLSRTRLKTSLRKP